MNLRQLLQRSDRPFLSQPQVGRYFPGASIEDARRRLARSVERGDGPGVVIGAAGTGKSLLLQVLAAQYHERFDVVLLACAQMHTRRGLLQAIHFELGLDHQQRDEGELRLSLLDHLLSADQSAEGLLLLVDEAQSLPTPLLEEIRVFGNLARNGAPRVRVVLAGLPSLEERLTSPELESLSQRLTARCYLTPFARAETSQYAMAQIAACGAEPKQIFAADAWDALFNATDGVPRVVNQLCDRAMLLADDKSCSSVDVAIVQAAWADLQQLPGSPNTLNDATPQSASRVEVVEFGSLEGDVYRESATTVVSQASAPRVPVNATTHFDTPVAWRRETIVTVERTPELSTHSGERRPQKFDDCVPEAIDPFVDEFEEEEILLDRFSVLSELFHAGTPRVANRRDPAFASFVGQALDNKLDAFEHAHSKAVDPRSTDAQQPGAGNQSSRRGFGPGQPTIRLAVVDEPAKHERSPASVQAMHAKLSPRVNSNFILDRPSMASSRATDDPILVIEDEPIRVSRPQPGVRREAYRDLFSRLRHGA